MRVIDRQIRGKIQTSDNITEQIIFIRKKCDIG